MRKIFFVCFALVIGTNLLGAQENCKVENEVPLRLMSQELKRSIKTFKKLHPPVYYLSYTYEDKQQINLSVKQGGVDKEQDKSSRLAIVARAGSPKMDNTRLLKGESNYSRQFVYYDDSVIPTPDTAETFRLFLWRSTQKIAEKAQEEFGRVQTNTQASATRQDDSDDFVLPPVSHYCHTQEPVPFDTEKIGQMLLKASELTRGKKFIKGSEFWLQMTQGHRYFADSQGTQIKTPFLLVRFGYEMSNQLQDGTRLSRSKTYDVIREDQLPGEEQFFANVKQSIEELEMLTNSPEADPGTVPTILKSRAMGVFVHEVLGHRLEGHRQKQDSFGKTFTSKIGQPVTAPFISVVDDATMAYFNGQPLRGFYEYDDEGVKAQPVTLIENGVLRGFLMSGSPIEGFPVSNGHGRASFGRLPVARMGNTRLIASKTVPYAELEKQLLQEIRSQNKPYGYIIEDLSGGFTMTESDMPQTFKLEPKLVYRMYPDGRKEIVHGADIVGTPLVSFGQIIAAADDDDVFNGTCGAESGWVPVSAISPSVLLKSLEIEKAAKSDNKPPILPSPYSLPKGGKNK